MSIEQFLTDDESVYIPVKRGNGKYVRGNFEWTDKKREKVKFVPSEKGEFNVIEIM